MALEQPLLLDSSIRDWVLFPILLVMILVGLVRHYITLLITSSPKPQQPPVVRQQRIITRAATLRSHFALIPRQAFKARLDWLTDALDKGTYIKPEEPKNPGEEDMPKNPLSDPAQMDQMMDMAKKSMVSMVPQTVIMGWINYFFTGFVLIRLPFPLTLRFKLMLQRGIDTSDMDVTWVSSISWYFLCLFGLNAIFRLILGDGNSADGTRDMAAMSNMGAGASPMGQQPDYKKLHAQEKESLELAGSDTKAKWIGDGIEGRVLAMYAK
ncbi:uncharacterized protein FA14DRAFT_169783 [Meira miltonrushii]|uniref:ER membrane protein complex subunit 3 n=1 Tax=Meira miltonrushii TaxID=1280837 RepID=A0A316VKJ2_9BASI|nr:uncharacterized protein FA14DRAFT_169783 [Meira miltonrushii]PWN36853.1 transmembrane protein [Meira miltonrushii]